MKKPNEAEYAYLNGVKQHLTVDNLKPIITNNLLNYGFLVPVTFVCAEDKSYVIESIELTSNKIEDVNAFIDDLSQFCMDNKAFKIIFAMETSRKDKNSIKNAIQITEICKDTAEMYIQQFTRENSKITYISKDYEYYKEAELTNIKPIQKALTTLQ